MWGYVDGRRDRESSRKWHIRLPGQEPIPIGYCGRRARSMIEKLLQWVWDYVDDEFLASVDPSDFEGL